MLKLPAEKRAKRETVDKGGETAPRRERDRAFPVSESWCGEAYDLFPPDRVPPAPSVPGVPEWSVCVGGDPPVPPRLLREMRLPRINGRRPERCGDDLSTGLPMHGFSFLPKMKKPPVR